MSLIHEALRAGQHLLVVMQHAQAMLPEALKRGLASLAHAGLNGLPLPETPTPTSRM